MNERFTLTHTFDIHDNLTGIEYVMDSVKNHPQDLCDLLNKVNARADRNAEELWKFKELMMKYEISSVEKLDLMLMEQKVW